MTHDEKEAHPDMTPMIDVVFQLLVFFLVSMKFKTLDMKIDAFLPKDKGLAPTVTEIEEKPKVVATLKRQPGERVTRVKYQNFVLGTTAPDQAGQTWAKLQAKAEGVRASVKSAGGDPNEVTGEVDAARHVPTGDVIRAVDALIAAGIENVTFVGTPPPGSALDQIQRGQ